MRRSPYRTPRALLLALVSSVIITAVMLLGALSPVGHAIEPHFHLLFTAVANLLLFTVLYTYNFWTVRSGMNRKATVAVGIAGSLAFSAAYAALQWWLEALLCGVSYNNYVITLTIDGTAAVMAYLVTLLLDNVTHYQQALIENEHLQAENMRIRYETLEHQLSPHFLFNSLNTLDGLIGVDNNNAHRYIHALADNFRYSLSHKDSVTLAEELSFARNYIAMMQMRYGKEALRVAESIDPSLLGRQLPRISLQLLLENAVKHNVATKLKPLTITIETAGESIRVTNAKQPKAEQKKGGGIGLANLSGRYQLLFNRTITIHDSEDSFSVELPLI